MPETTTEFRRDRNGFPITDCYRCGGSGRYSWNQIHLDMCYGCQGSGVAHEAGARKHVAAWRDAVRAAVRVVAQDLRAGDTVKPWGAADPITGRRYSADERPERTVACVTVTDDECGWSGAERTVTGWYTLVWWGRTPEGGECDLADDECFGAVYGERCHRHRDEPVEPERMNGQTMFHRCGVRIDPAPYVAAAERGVRWVRTNPRPRNTRD